MQRRVCRVSPSLLFRPAAPLIGQRIDLPGEAGQLLVGDAAAGAGDACQALDGGEEAAEDGEVPVLLRAQARDGNALRHGGIYPVDKIKDRPGVGGAGGEAVFVGQAVCIRLYRRVVAVVDEDHLRLGVKAAYPF